MAIFAAKPTITLNFIAPDARKTCLQGRIGKSLMAAAVAGDIDGIAADCGGSLTCATCHVLVAEPFASMLPPPAAEELAMLQPSSVSPGLVALVAEDAPTRTILLAGAGSFEQAHITMTQGVFLPADQLSAEAVIARLGQTANRRDETVPVTGFDQLKHEIAKAKSHQAEFKT